MHLQVKLSYSYYQNLVRLRVFNHLTDTVILMAIQTRAVHARMMDQEAVTNDIKIDLGIKCALIWKVIYLG